jgi:hypothetical protein
VDRPLDGQDTGAEGALAALREMRAGLPERPLLAEAAE